MALKLFTPYMSDEAIKNVEKVLRSGQLAEGEEVKLFEHEITLNTDLRNVVALNSGTSALELAYELAGVDVGDEVITPVLTCTATNLPILHRGATVVFADIDTDLNVSVADVEKKITAKTKALVFVHFGGNNRGLGDIIALGKKYGIPVIEDAAQAIGTEYYGKADFTCISLQAIKTLTTGDGGLLCVKDPVLYQKARRLRWFGYDREEKQRKGDTDLVEAGYKYHMNNISAAIGRGNLLHLKELVAHREKLGEIYKSYGLFAHMWLAGGFTDDYAGLKAKMLENGIEIGQHHYRNDQYTVFGGRQKFPTMDSIEGKYYFVPMHHGISEEDARIISKLCKE